MLAHRRQESLLEGFAARLAIGEPSTINQLLDDAVLNARRILADLLEDIKIHNLLSGFDLFSNVTVLFPFFVCVQALKRKLLGGLTPDTWSGRACTTPSIRLDVKLQKRLDP